MCFGHAGRLSTYDYAPVSSTTGNSGRNNLLLQSPTNKTFMCESDNFVLFLSAMFVSFLILLTPSNLFRSSLLMGFSSLMTSTISSFRCLTSLISWVTFLNFFSIFSFLLIRCYSSLSSLTSSFVPVFGGIYFSYYLSYLADSITVVCPHHLDVYTDGNLCSTFPLSVLLFCVNLALSRDVPVFLLHYNP